MKDTQNITIGLLLITAVILGAMLISSYMTSNNVAYAGSSVKQADYIMGNGTISRSVDLVYVVDIAARQLNAYTSDINTNTINLVDRVDLNRAFSQ